MKLTPASRARWMMRIDSSWSGLPQAPNIIAPRHSLLTWTPVRPGYRCSIGLPGLVGGAAGWLAGVRGFGRGAPARQEVERPGRGRAGLSGVDAHRQAGVGVERHRLVGQVQVA